MANTAAYNGFQQYSGTGSAPTYEQVAVQIAYNASAIYYGDPVNPDANGYVVVGVTTGASANTQIAGVFVGCQYLSVSQKRTSNGISGAFLATLGTTDTTFPFKVVSLITDPPGVNGTESGAYQKAVVAFNFVQTKALPGV